MRKIISPLVLLNWYQGRRELMKIRAAQTYLGGVKTVRSFYLGCLFILSALILLFSGIFLIHTALLTYTDWSMRTKLIVGLTLGAFELIAAGGVMFYIFKEETWSRLFHVSRVLDCILKDKSHPKSGGVRHGNGKLHKNH